MLRSTGVVTGEFGFAEAYEQKAANMKSWEADPRAEVRDFAANMVGDLLRVAKNERRRAVEDIAVRKHVYGVRPDTRESSQN